MATLWALGAPRAEAKNQPQMEAMRDWAARRLRQVAQRVHLRSVEGQARMLEASVLVVVVPPGAQTRQQHLGVARQAVGLVLVARFPEGRPTTQPRVARLWPVAPQLVELPLPAELAASVDLMAPAVPSLLEEPLVSAALQVARVATMQRVEQVIQAEQVVR